MWQKCHYLSPSSAPTREEQGKASAQARMDASLGAGFEWCTGIWLLWTLAIFVFDWENINAKQNLFCFILVSWGGAQVGRFHSRLSEKPEWPSSKSVKLERFWERKNGWWGLAMCRGETASSAIYAGMQWSYSHLLPVAKMGAVGPGSIKSHSISSLLIRGK